MAFSKIPLSFGNQKFNVRLNNQSYRLQVVFRINTWYLDIFDSTDKLLVTAIPLVQGINLLEQYQHIIRGSLYVLNSNEDELQTFSTLSTEMSLFYEDPA